MRRFNTRVSSTLGWERAARKLIPTPRRAAQFDLTQMVLESGAAPIMAGTEIIIFADLDAMQMPTLSAATIDTTMGERDFPLSSARSAFREEADC